nr:hypothetical protein [Tanacetum cinerariifolium]
MLRAFPISLTGAVSRWLINEPTGSILTWEVLKSSFLSKYCPPARTTKKMEEINNFQQILDSKGAIHAMTATNAKVAIQQMAKYSQKWHNRTSTKIKSTETSNGLAAIQAQLNNLEREIKNVNEKDKDDHEGKTLAETLIDIPIFIGNFSIISSFIIIDDMDDNVISGVVLGMPFFKKFVSCQKIIEKFTLGDAYEQKMEE